MRLLVPKLMLGAALCAGLATLTANPAAAVDTEIGAVHVSNAEYTDVLWTRFGGPVSQFTVIPMAVLVGKNALSLTSPSNQTAVRQAAGNTTTICTDVSKEVR